MAHGHETSSDINNVRRNIRRYEIGISMTMCEQQHRSWGASSGSSPCMRPMSVPSVDSASASTPVPHPPPASASSYWSIHQPFIDCIKNASFLHL